MVEITLKVIKFKVTILVPATKQDSLRRVSYQLSEVPHCNEQEFVLKEQKLLLINFMETRIVEQIK
jgi:hypothetical protein